MSVYRAISVAGRDPVQVCLHPDAGDPVTPWLLEHDWIDEPVQRAFLDHVGPGMRVLDLGSHLGLFALTAASLGASVLAFDAVPWHAEQVRQAAAHNGFEDFEVVHGVIAAEPGTVPFVTSSLQSHVHAPGSVRFAEDVADHVIDVPAVVVDDVLDAAGWDTVDVVKMDIEGSEPQALAGMSRMFERARPAVVFEANGIMLPLYGSGPLRLRRWFQRRDYRLWLVDHLRPGTLVEADELRVQPECVVDYLALPEDREPPSHWTIVPPFSRQETLTRLLDQAAVDSWPFREYVARTFARGPRWLRQDPLVPAGLGALAQDLDAIVREATPAPVRRRKVADDVTAEAAAAPGGGAARRRADTGAAPGGAPAPDPRVVVLARGVGLAEGSELLARAHGQPHPPLVLRDLSFHVGRGTLVGLLGSHPSEQSLVLEALAGRRRVATGALHVRARPLLLSHVPEGLEPDLTVRENIAVFAAYLGRDAVATANRADELADRAGLTGRLDDPLGEQAADGVQRLALTLVLEDPHHDLVLIDGLPQSLDPDFRHWARERTEILRRAGTTFVQAVRDPAALLGGPDRMLYLADGTLAAAGHPASVDDLARRHALGLGDRAA